MKPLCKDGSYTAKVVSTSASTSSNFPSRRERAARGSQNEAEEHAGSVCICTTLCSPTIEQIRYHFVMRAYATDAKNRFCLTRFLRVIRGSAGCSFFGLSP